MEGACIRRQALQRTAVLEEDEAEEEEDEE
jgi:hypothetical protein